jgi:hypothetical protein
MWFILLIFPQKSEDLSEISLLFVFCVEGREKEVPEGKINKKGVPTFSNNISKSSTIIILLN